MKVYSHIISLNERKYLLHDMAEGEAVLIIKHQQITPSRTLQMLINDKKHHQRIITLDITEHFPATVSAVTCKMLNRLVDDMNLLCDIYWLTDIELYSYYQVDIVKQHFYAQK